MKDDRVRAEDGVEEPCDSYHFAGFLGAAGFAILGMIFSVLLYNHLVLSRNRTRAAWSGIDVQLKRRSSLIPNLVETVRGYTRHEPEVFSEVSQARGALVKAGTPLSAAAADQALTAALGRLMAVAEAYLTASRCDVSTVADGPSDTEEKIAYARQFYNQNALDYNTRIQSFPGNQFASWFRFGPFDYFRAEEGPREDVKVNFTGA
jgi:LemA protein